MFFKTRAEADAEFLRQRTLLERHSREAIGLQHRDMSEFISARKRLAEYGRTINDAVEFFVDHQERVRRCKTTVAELAAEVIEAKRRDGRSDACVRGLVRCAKILPAAILLVREFAASPDIGVSGNCSRRYLQIQIYRRFPQ